MLLLRGSQLRPLNSGEARTRDDDDDDDDESENSGWIGGPSVSE